MGSTLAMVIVAVLVSLPTLAQHNFRKFKVGLGAGYALHENIRGGGVLVYGEPAFRISDKVQVGLRLEAAAMALPDQLQTTTLTTTDDVLRMRSATVNLQYYFSNNRFRPLVGIGGGRYERGLSSIRDFSTIRARQTLHGVYGRVGFDFQHVTFSIDYNMIEPAADLRSSGSHYWGIRTGFVIGGGDR